MDVWFFAVLVAYFLVPHAVFVMWDTTSLAAGLVLIGAVLGPLLIARTRLWKPSVMTLGVVSMTLAALSLSSVLALQTPRTVFSLALLAVVLPGALVVHRIGRTTTDADFVTLRRFTWMLLAIGWFGLVEPPAWLPYASLEKPIIPFAEHSHYGLTAGLFACGVAATFRKRTGAFAAAVLLVQGLMLPNLTVLAAALLSFAIVLCRLWSGRPVVGTLVVVPFIGVLALMPILVAGSEASDYFTGRLALSGESSNLSALVFLRGWQLVSHSLAETTGVGVGFQMLGEPGVFDVPLSERIRAVAGRDFNQFDGGFLAAKLIAETGLLGLALIVFHLISLPYCLCFLVSAAPRDNPEKPSRVKVARSNYLIGMWIGLSLELYLRGYGYFSPGFGILLGSLSFIIVLPLARRRPTSEPISRTLRPRRAALDSNHTQSQAAGSTERTDLRLLTKGTNRVD